MGFYVLVGIIGSLAINVPIEKIKQTAITVRKEKRYLHGGVK